MIVMYGISIHAAQEGCDPCCYYCLYGGRDFNPRSPRGLRPVPVMSDSKLSLFQSTQPKRAATVASTWSSCAAIGFQSTQPKRAATMGMPTAQLAYSEISIHAARVGCDRFSFASKNNLKRFQSTQPEWAATCAAKATSSSFSFISIHAARVGCDADVWQATNLQYSISIHAARVGCDNTTGGVYVYNSLFQSTQPEWAATGKSTKGGIHNAISIHAARVGCDGDKVFTDNVIGISIHAARVGCDISHPRRSRGIAYFNPRSPSGLRL